MRELTPEQKRILQQNTNKHRAEAVSKMKEVTAEEQAQVATKQVVISLIVDQMKRTERNRKQITQDLVKKGYPEEPVAKLVAEVFARVKQATAQRHLKRGAIGFVISIGITMGSYMMATATPLKIWFVAPITFLYSIGYMLSGFTLWLRFRDRS
jgi:cation transport ATPase